MISIFFAKTVTAVSSYILFNYLEYKEFFDFKNIDKNKHHSFFKVGQKWVVISKKDFLEQILEKCSEQNNSFYLKSTLCKFHYNTPVI